MSDERFPDVPAFVTVRDAAGETVDIRGIIGEEHTYMFGGPDLLPGPHTIRFAFTYGWRRWFSRPWHPWITGGERTVVADSVGFADGGEFSLSLSGITGDDDYRDTYAWWWPQRWRR